ncbi:toll/interleukin-1 receptor domain-containing protein [Hoeflea sp. AS16]|uniref:toll/interleukin-1 receptor domain-containing protein n=1 Tax=Hoeflea sp. AS16 TaxID=3135779 RepID=UPI0031717730
MSFLDQYQNDIFVSYSHVDNLADMDGQQCVSMIVRQMRSILKQRLSRDGVEIYWDDSHLRANQVVDEALQAQVASSGIMLAVTSPAYFDPDSYTLKELEWFLQQPGAGDRLFVLEVLPVDNENEMHPEVFTRKRFQFWQASGGAVGTPMILDPRHDRQPYMTALTEFCGQLRERLVGLKKEAGGIAPGSAQPAEPAATVLLCQTTDDLEYERGQVRSALQQFNIRVLPEMEYPQGGKEFRQAYEADLAEAGMVVQLMGRAGGRMPADMPNGYLSYQCDAAISAGKPLVAWRHPEVEPSEIENSVHRAQLQRAEVITCGLESLKTLIVKSLEEQKRPAREVRSSLIFIGADRTDMPLAKELLQALSKRGLPVAVPIYEGTPDEIQEDLTENLIDSDSVIFVHGAAPTKWVRSFMRRLSRSLADRSGPPDCTAMIKAPPPKSEGVNFSFPNLQIIDCTDGFDVERIISQMEPKL